MEYNFFLSELLDHKLQDIFIASRMLKNSGFFIEGYLGAGSFGAVVLARNIESSK